MSTRFIGLVALSVVAGTQLVPSVAEAGMRLCLPFLICPHTTSSDDGDYERGYEGEEPVYISPKKKKTSKAALEQSRAVVKKKATRSTGNKTPSADSAISCDRAEKIVSGYGFANVTANTCTGQVFAFNAMRSGNAYVIKLNSASGELTEVNKVQ